MTISFFIAQVDNDGNSEPACAVNHRECYGTCSDEGDFECYGICDCCDANRDACPYCSLELNVSNVNAATTFNRLELDSEYEYGGTIEPNELLGRSMTGNIGQNDSGTAPVEFGNFIAGGVRAGYYEDRLTMLSEIATKAKAAVYE